MKAEKSKVKWKVVISTIDAKKTRYLIVHASLKPIAEKRAMERLEKEYDDKWGLDYIEQI